MIDNIPIHQVIETIVSVLNARDPYTFEHSWRVASLAEHIAKEMNIDNKWAVLVHIAAHLHDIGKVGVPDNILNKCSALSESEFDIMKSHSRIGYNIVNNIDIFKETSFYILHHHEKWDGTGYPSGLKGKEIPLGARIIAMADCFDAMTSKRCYKNAIDIDKAINEITRLKGIHFCPEVVNAFLSIKDDLPSILNDVNLEIKAYE